MFGKGPDICSLRTGTQRVWIKMNKVFVSCPLLVQSFVHSDLAVASPVILPGSFLQLVEITEFLKVEELEGEVASWSGIERR